MLLLSYCSYFYLMLRLVSTPVANFVISLKLPNFEGVPFIT